MTSSRGSQSAPVSRRGNGDGSVAEAKNVQLTDTQFHTVDWDPTSAQRIGRESVNLVFVGEWLGETVAFQMSASRYVPSDGRWTDWNVYRHVGYSDTPLSETASRKLADAAKPAVREWLDSDAYVESRETAVAYMVKALIQEDARYGASVSRCRRALQTVESELRATDQIVLWRAVNALQGYLNAMDAVKPSV